MSRWCWMMLDVFDGFWWRCFWFGLLYLCCSETVQKGLHLSFHKLYCTFKYSIQPNSILYSHLWAFIISQATNLNMDFRVDTPTRHENSEAGWGRIPTVDRNGKEWKEDFPHISQVLGIAKWHHFCYNDTFQWNGLLGVLWGFPENASA